MNNDARRGRLIDIAESLPEVVVEPGGSDVPHLSMSIRKKRLAWYLDDHHGDGMIALTCKAPDGVNRALTESDPERYFIPSYTGPKGWVGLRLDLDTVDWDEVEGLLTDAYRMTAPKKLIGQLDEAT